MKYIEKVGNIKVYTEKMKNGFITITFMNGTDIVVQKLYSTEDINWAISNLFEKEFDTYTLEYIQNFTADKLSDNTYKIGEKDYFCRIDNSRFFKYYHKYAKDFITDKNGMRIIDY